MGTGCKLSNDTGWVQEQNSAREEIYHRDTRRRCPPGSTPEFIEGFIAAEAQKTKQRCTPEKEIQDDLVAKIEEHFRFHPLIQIHPDNRGNIQHDPWKYWKIQVQDMHQF